MIYNMTRVLFAVILSTQLLISTGCSRSDDKMINYYANGQSIIAAIEHDDHEWIDKLLNEGANLHLQDGYHNHALNYAIEKGASLNIIKRIFEKDTLPNGANGNPSPLLIATQKNQLPVVEFLLSQKVDVNTNKEDTTPLIEATKHSDGKIAALLLQHGADPSIVAENQDSALIGAIINKNLTLAKELLKKKNPISTCKYGCVSPPILQAIDSGNIAMIELLINNGASLDAYDYSSLSGAMHAAVQDNAKVVRMLLKKGLKADIRNGSSDTPLDSALETGRTEIAKLFFNAGVQEKSKVYDGNHLHNAIRNGYHGIVELLLERSYDVNAYDDDGLTPIMRATERADLKMVKLLHKHGASLELKPKGDNAQRTYGTLMDIAMGAHNAELVTYLMESGVILDKKLAYKNYMSALVFKSNKGMIELLIQAGASCCDNNDDEQKKELLEWIEYASPDHQEELLGVITTNDLKFNTDSLATLAGKRVCKLMRKDAYALAKALFDRGAHIGDSCNIDSSLFKDAHKLAVKSLEKKLAREVEYANFKGFIGAPVMTLSQEGLMDLFEIGVQKEDIGMVNWVKKHGLKNSAIEEKIKKDFRRGYTSRAEFYIRNGLIPEPQAYIEVATQEKIDLSIVGLLSIYQTSFTKEQGIKIIEAIIDNRKSKRYWSTNLIAALHKSGVLREASEEMKTELLVTMAEQNSVAVHIILISEGDNLPLNSIKRAIRSAKRHSNSKAVKHLLDYKEKKS